MLITAFRASAYDPINQWMLFNGSYTFDGSRVNSGMSLGSNAVNAMTQDAAGNIWFGVSGKGLRMWDGKKLTDPKAPKDSYAMTAEVLSIATDSKGVVWLGTSEGLVKYDGSSWTNIAPDVTGLHAVREIVVTPTDKVYLSGFTSDGAGFTGGGIAFYNGQGWTKFDASNSSIPDTMMQNLTLDANNHLWMTFGNNDLGLAKFDGKNWKLFNSSNGLPANNIRAITTNKGGKMYFAATKGLLEYDGTAWAMRPYSNGFGPRMMDAMATKGELDVQSVMVEDNGTVWIGIRNGGVYSIRDENYARYFDASNSMLPGNSVMKMFTDRLGVTWMLTGQQNSAWRKTYFEKYHGQYTGDNNGVVALKEYGRITDPKWTIYDNLGFNSKLGMPYDIGEDKAGAIWLSGSSGLVRLKDGKFKAFTYKNDLQSAFNRMHIAPDGKIYLNTAITGIKVYDNGTISDFAKWPNMGGVLGMATDAKGAFWSAGSGGLSLRKAEDWETFNKKNGDLPSVIVYTVFSDSRGRLWAGTAKGLARYNDTVFVKEEAEFPSDDIQCIAEDSKGRLWVGSNKGLSILDGTTWTHISKVESPKLKNFRVNSISLDKNDVAWMATESDGLLRYDGAAWTQYDQKNTATLFDHIDAVKAASDGTIYVSSGPTEFQLGQSDFMMPNAQGDEAILNGLKTRIRASDPKKVFVIIQP
jgi:ligand-binding sensor domain-containing protein